MVFYFYFLFTLQTLSQGLPTVTAGRILRGQSIGKNGESFKTAMESLDYSGLSKTYTVDFQIPDSAATATAFLTGTKTKFYTRKCILYTV